MFLLQKRDIFFLTQNSAREDIIFIYVLDFLPPTIKYRMSKAYKSKAWHAPSRLLWFCLGKLFAQTFSLGYTKVAREFNKIPSSTRESNKTGMLNPSIRTITYFPWTMDLGRLLPLFPFDRSLSLPLFLFFAWKMKKKKCCTILKFVCFFCPTIFEFHSSLFNQMFANDLLKDLVLRQWWASRIKFFIVRTFLNTLYLWSKVGDPNTLGILLCECMQGVVI